MRTRRVCPAPYAAATGGWEGGVEARSTGRTPSGEWSGQVRLDVAQDRVLRLRADHARDLLAALEQDQADGMLITP